VFSNSKGSAFHTKDTFIRSTDFTKTTQVLPLHAREDEGGIAIMLSI
jgi:hypothetical protein